MFWVVPLALLRAGTTFVTRDKALMLVSQWEGGWIREFLSVEAQVGAAATGKSFSGAHFRPEI